MAETAAHLVDHVFPRLPVRQWVLSFPKRLRYHLDDAELQNAVLHRFLRCIEQGMRQGLVEADGRTRLGAVVLIHRFGALLNAHLHFHVVVIDGVFCGEDAETLRFEAVRLAPEAVQRLLATIRKRIVRLFVRRGRLDKAEGDALCACEHGGGFSLDAGVRIEASDRQGLERLLRYGARPAFAQERLRQIDAEHLVYESPKPGPGGRVSQIPTPLELMDRLAALIPPPPGDTGIATTVCWRRIRRCGRRSRRWRRCPSPGRSGRMPWPRKAPSVGRRVMCGRCCWRASMKCSHRPVRSAAARCGSSPSSTIRPR